MKKKLLSVFLVLVLALGLTTTAFAAGLPFKDVPADAWYYQDVAQPMRAASSTGGTGLILRPTPT